MINQTLTADEKIDMYRDVYFQYYGIHPIIVKNGAWITINDDPNKNYRAKDLLKMSWFYLAKIQDDRKNRNWKQVNQNIINMFLDRLFIACHNSAYEMEACLNDFGLSGEVTKGLDELWTDSNGVEPKHCDEDDCDLLHELKVQILNLEEEVENIQRKKRKAIDNKKEMESDNKELKEGIAQKEMEIKNIKSRSVFFSMDDLSEEGYTNEDGDVWGIP